jgi:hypothetical protein
VTPPRIARTLRVVREGTGTAARLFIDGEPFGYAVTGGLGVSLKRGEMPGVTVTIAGWRVEVVDDTGAAPGELSLGAEGSKGDG